MHASPDEGPATIIEPPADGGLFASATTALVVLTLVNFINYVDRQIIAPLVPLLQLPVSEGGLGISDTQAGLLGSAFMVVHSLASIPLGIAADRFLRTRVIGFGVALWSLATGLAGLARNFWHLFFARAAVGIGEAAYAPAATALISERFTPAKRARALGIFQGGMLLGGAVGLVLGGVVADALGWRAAFFLVGPPGILLALVVVKLWEPPRAPRPASSASGSFVQRIKAHITGKQTAITPSADASMALRHTTPGVRQSLIWINVAGILITFFVGAVIFWGIEFLLREHFNWDKSKLGEATLLFGGIAVPLGVLGTLCGSLLADRLERSRPGAGRLLTIAIGMMCCVPFAAIGFFAGNLVVVLGAIGLGVFFASFYVGPVLAVLHDVVAPHRRATATAIYFFLVHLLGDAISPGIVGVISDLTATRTTHMLAGSPVVVVDAGLHWGLAATLIPAALGGVAALLAMPHARTVAAAKGRV